MDLSFGPSDNPGMFLRTVKVRSSAGIVHEYVRVVEASRESGKSVQRVVANLGRKDFLLPLLPQLLRVLKGDVHVEGLAPSVAPMESLTFGPVLVTRALFAELGLWEVLEACKRGTAKDPGSQPDFADRVFALIANRLTRPGSEHGIARWLETDFVCDRQGRRFVPMWKTSHRVKVDSQQLQRWYRTLDRLIEHKERIEFALYERLRDLFNLKPDLVFYDLTSTYFEGRGPAEFALHGHSRDGKPRNPQVIVGMVMIAGWPIAHHVFKGNLRDSTTVGTVLEDLKDRFQFRRVVFVGDRGMVTTENIDALRKREHGYLVGLNRRRRPEIETLIDRATGEWIECPLGINGREKLTDVLQTNVQEVASDTEGVRVFVVQSEERRRYEVSQREKVMERTRLALERLKASVASGRLKAPEKIGAAAARILGRHHGHRYYDWKIEGRQFEYFEHPVHLRREKKFEGKYLIQTEEKDLTPVEAVVRYKELSEVERGFRSLKDPLGMRPVYHWVERRVRAHIFVAALAFLLDRLLERKLKEAGVDLSSTHALQAVESVRWVRFTVDDRSRTGVTPGSPRARQVLNALNIKDRHPPPSPKADETVV